MEEEQNNDDDNRSPVCMDYEINVRLGAESADYEKKTQLKAGQIVTVLQFVV